MLISSRRIAMTTRNRLDTDQLRSIIREEYAEVAACPLKGFHFHTGRFLASRLGYPAEPRSQEAAGVEVEPLERTGRNLGVLFPNDRTELIGVEAISRCHGNPP